jgi:hypothetical protein
MFLINFLIIVKEVIIDIPHDLKGREGGSFLLENFPNIIYHSPFPIPGR